MTFLFDHSIVSPSLVDRMLKIQPHRLIGQSLRHAARHIIEIKRAFCFQHSCSLEKPNEVEISLLANQKVNRLLRKISISLIDYFLIEILQHFVQPNLSATSSSITESKPGLVESVWQHLLTCFVDGKCSKSVLVSNETKAQSPAPLLENDFQFWSDQQACEAVQRLIDVSVRCAEHGPERTDYAHANEYLVLALQQMATTGYLFSPCLTCEPLPIAPTPVPKNREDTRRKPNNRRIPHQGPNNREAPRKKEVKTH